MYWIMLGIGIVLHAGAYLTIVVVNRRDCRRDAEIAGERSPSTLSAAAHTV